jgi:Helix-turn-helix domain
MKAEQKLAHQRLSVLELAEALGNVSEACRRRGISRTQFYEYKRRLQTHGMEGLKDLPPVHKSHPMAIPEEVQEKIVALSLSRPCVIGLAERQGNNLEFRNRLYARVAQSSPQLRPTVTTVRDTTPLVALPEARFDFMNDSHYRKFAYTAQRGAARAYNSESHRLALIGYGSAVEAILIDWLISLSPTDLSNAIAAAEVADRANIWNRGEKAKGPTGWRLVNLIRVATCVGALTGAATMSDKLREFRNWVHPSSAISSGLAEDDLEPEAQSACGTFSAIVRDVERSVSP